MARNTTDTPVQGFNRPAVGDDWAASWDELVETLDEKVVGRGLESNRPASGDYDNQLYLATDTQTLYRWDSGTASWNKSISIDKITEIISPSSTGTTESPQDDVNSVRVEPDGTTTIDLSATEQKDGREITFVKTGGSNTPVVSFQSSDFLSSEPVDLSSDGDTVSVEYVNGAVSGWVVK